MRVAAKHPCGAAALRGCTEHPLVEGYCFLVPICPRIHTSRFDQKVNIIGCLGQKPVIFFQGAGEILLLYKLSGVFTHSGA
jgi:hypothetical protein